MKTKLKANHGSVESASKAASLPMAGGAGGGEEGESKAIGLTLVTAYDSSDTDHDPG